MTVISRKIDFEGVLEGELYGPLKDLTVFQQVKLDREGGNLVWPSGADFDPEILHDWPERKAAMLAAAVRWRKGEYAVRKGNSGRATAVEPTQAEAIKKARELNPKMPPKVERVRNTKTGGRDKWRKP